MPAGKTPYPLFAKGTALPATSTSKANAQLVSAVVNVSHYGGKLYWSITNGATAPAVAPAITIQSSPDGVDWFDEYTVGGDTVANSHNANSVEIPRGAGRIRALAYSGTGTSTVQPVSLHVVFNAFMSL